MSRSKDAGDFNYEYQFTDSPTPKPRAKRPVAWMVVHKGACSDGRDARDVYLTKRELREECCLGANSSIYPLYAGDPVRVDKGGKGKSK